MKKVKIVNQPRGRGWGFTSIPKYPYFFFFQVFTAKQLKKISKTSFFPSLCVLAPWVFILKNHTGNALDDKNAENMMPVL